MHRCTGMPEIPTDGLRKGETTRGRVVLKVAVTLTLLWPQFGYAQAEPCGGWDTLDTKVFTTDYDVAHLHCNVRSRGSSILVLQTIFLGLGL